MLKVSHLYYSYEKEVIFKDASFSAFPGEVTIILGRSGAGKSTLFRLLSGFLTPEKGSFLWSGTPLTQKHVAYMQQQEALLPWRTALKNILLSSELGPSYKRSAISPDHLQQVIESFNLSSLLDRYPDELSGGQKQRVALASQCLSQKPVLLLDEPFSSLDVVLKEKLYKDIVALAKQKNKVVILVTHDFRDVLFLGDTLFIIKNNKLTPVSLGIPRSASDQQLGHLKRLLEI